ncbi:RAD55 family ATPase [Luteolibacter luteus]|uniref:AAA family ATPase n=1 Tax=Luteolibacter luteus TaxID=2728835 RepID=A0A858REM1_9BACT|nr:DnaB-like helicase C-terminal domain-containing protein [Luteolibacter luteus]QJE95277.1 AAA family ATPase [Luteolibacter luteus]
MVIEPQDGSLKPDLDRPTGIPAYRHTGIPAYRHTGIPELDEVLGPVMLEGGVVLVAGASGGGKTALACQVAQRAAIAGRQVLYLSSEIADDEALERMLSSAIPWNYDLLKDGGLQVDRVDTLAVPSDRNKTRSSQRKRFSPFVAWKET